MNKLTVWANVECCGTYLSLRPHGRFRCGGCGTLWGHHHGNKSGPAVVIKEETERE